MAYPDYNELLSVLWGSASIEPVGTSALIASASNILVSTNVSIDRPTIGGGGNQPIVPPVILAAPTPTTIPLTLAGAFEQSANLFNITSFNGVDGNLMSVDETGLTTVPKLRLSELHSASALATDGNGSIVAAVLAPSAFIDTTNAYNISSGILDAARLPVIPVGNISGLAPSATIDTTNANNITSGILAVARLPLIPTTKISGLATVATSGLYADLINKPLLAATIAAVTNKFLTSYNATTGLFTQAQVSAANIGGLATVATTGSYTDLTNKPVLPLNTPGIPDQVLTSYNAATGAFAMAQLAAGNITGLAVVAATGSYTDLSNKPVLAATKALVAKQYFTSYSATTGLFTSAQIAVGDLSGLVLPVTNAFTATQYFTAYDATTGLFSKAQIATSDISGVFAPGQIPTQLPFPAGFGVAAVATQGVTIAALAASGAAATGLTVNATTGATANYAATFIGGFVGIGTLTPTAMLNISGAAVATSGANFASGAIRQTGNYWNGASSAADFWQFAQTLGAGTNPISTLALTHSGSPGTTLFSIATPTKITDATLATATGGIGALNVVGGIACGNANIGGTAISGISGSVLTLANNASSATSIQAIGADIRNSSTGTMQAMMVRSMNSGGGSAVAISGVAAAQLAVTAPNCQAVTGQVQAATGATITQAIDFYAQAPTAPSSTITNAYGLYVQDFANIGTALNLAVYTAGTTPSAFMGAVGIGTTAPKAPLHVMNLPIYATNAAAITGGLTAGAFYRIGADPDHICVVH